MGFGPGAPCKLRSSRTLNSSSLFCRIRVSIRAGQSTLCFSGGSIVVAVPHGHMNIAGPGNENFFT